MKNEQDFIVGDTMTGEWKYVKDEDVDNYTYHHGGYSIQIKRLFSGESGPHHWYEHLKEKSWFNAECDWNFVKIVGEIERGEYDNYSVIEELAGKGLNEEQIQFIFEKFIGPPSDYIIKEITDAVVETELSNLVKADEIKEKIIERRNNESLLQQKFTIKKCGRI